MREIDEIVKMSEEDRSKKVEALKTSCICDDCPTYNDCARNTKELIYCLTDKSPSCIKDEDGCICPSCPIAAQIRLTDEYYCIKGPEKQLTRKK